MNPLLYFWLFFKASLFSTGGMGNLPSLHADLIARRWAVERHFGESLLIGQLSPGPNGLWVISLGYLTDGVRGALLALLAIALPPLLVIGVELLYQGVQGHPAVEGFMHGLSLAVVGISVVVLARLMRDVGLDLRSVVIAVGAILLALTRRVPILAIVGLAAFAGIVLR